MATMTTIAGLEKRCDRLFEKADALKEELDAEEVVNKEESGATKRKCRMMREMYLEATTISICLAAFEREMKLYAFKDLMIKKIKE